MILFFKEFFIRKLISWRNSSIFKVISFDPTMQDGIQLLCIWKAKLGETNQWMNIYLVFKKNDKLFVIAIPKAIIEVYFH